MAVDTAYAHTEELIEVYAVAVAVLMDLTVVGDHTGRVDGVVEGQSPDVDEIRNVDEAAEVHSADTDHACAMKGAVEAHSSVDVRVLETNVMA